MKKGGSKQEKITEHFCCDNHIKIHRDIINTATQMTRKEEEIFEYITRKQCFLKV